MQSPASVLTEKGIFCLVKPVCCSAVLGLGGKDGTFPLSLPFLKKKKEAESVHL